MQGLLIAASKAKDVKYDYSVTSANCTVEVVKMMMSLIALTKAGSGDVYHSHTALITLADFKKTRVYFLISLAATVRPLEL